MNICTCILNRKNSLEKKVIPKLYEVWQEEDVMVL